jgi:hypothetical protein
MQLRRREKAVRARGARTRTVSSKRARYLLTMWGVICMDEKEAEKRRVRLEIIVAMLNDDPLLRDQVKVYLT